MILLFSDGPINVMISPEDSIFVVGDSVTCSALANPSPTYSWKNEDGGVVSTGQTLTFDTEHVGIWYLSCEASNGLSTSFVQRQIHICEES